MSATRVPLGRRAFLKTMSGGLALGAAVPTRARAQQAELKIGYMPHPIHENSIKWMKVWAAERKVTLTPVPTSYEVYVEKMTANLTSRGGQYDIIWHNDDWGQLWGRYLEPVDDVAAIKKMNRFLYEPPFVWEGKDTGVAFVETIGTFFYRTDLLSEGEFPKTWDDLVKTSQRLQKDGKVKWGFTGGMKYPHGWFTFFWSIWANGGDLLLPVHERRNEELAKAGWKSGLAEPEAVQAVEFWWDNIKTHKIAPPGQPGYSRDDANAIFMAGDAAITMADTTLYGKFNDPKQSKVAGKISVASFPMGPRAKFKSIAWRDAWAWAIPIHVDPAKKKLAKDLLNWINLNHEAQVDLWKATGGFPPNEEVQRELIKTDPVFRKFRAATVESEKIIHGAFYFARWPEFFATGIDHLVKAVTGPRDAIKATLVEGGKKMSEIAARA
ncbi:MAG TPA: extracellular solute-binding protein [Methylomirabilota bacterium]|nr:extracellular solute-binding protein [Methylomirabilota bacterium]